MSKSLLQLTPYALVEFDYSVTSIGTEDISFILFDSSYTNERQILNATVSNNLTSNILDRSAVRLTDTRSWAHLDQDRPIPYDVYDSFNLSKKLLSNETPTNWPVSYETVKLHLLSGYNLEDLDGLLLSIEYPEVSGKNCTIAQIAYLKGDEYVKFNPRPIVISGRSYDRYIEVKIPSLYYLNTQFYTTPTSASLAYWLTSDNKGFLKDGLISVTLREITTSNDDGTSLKLTTGEVSNVTFKQTDAFSLLSAVIKENEEEDCFEYYPSWQSGFIEDLVTDLNGVGGDYYVFHELYIYEQVGFDQIQTDYFVSIQEGDFNAPKRFRPILKNGDSAYSFSIDYVMRLTDRATGNQIIRNASVTSFDPKSYGRKIQKVNLDTSVKSFKIYNKIIEENKLQINKKAVETKLQRVFTPTFFDFNEIAVNTSNVILKSDGTFTSESVWNWDVIFGQGEAILLIHPFENYVKFKLHRYLQNNVTQSLDLRFDVDIFLVVEYNGKQVKFSKVEGFYSTNLAEGEIIFKIPSKEASAIYTSDGGIFYITSKVPSFIKVKVMDTYVGGIANREINIPSKEYYSKGETDNFEIVFDGNTYFVQKNMLQVIQVIPSGSGVSETILYTGKWRRMQDADKVKDDIENIRKAELERVLNQIRSSQLSLNTRQTEINQKAAELAALEARLSAQSVALTNQNNLLTNLQQELSGKDKILSDRERQVRENAKKASEIENQNIAKFQEQMNKVLKSLEDQQNAYLETIEELKNRDTNTGSDVNTGNENQGGGTQGNQGSGNQGGGNQGSGNQGSGNQGSGNQGGGTQGNQGSGNQGTGTQGTQGTNKKNIKTVDFRTFLDTVNYVDFAGVSGNDMAVLPGVGLQPSTKDTGLDTSKKGLFPIVGGGPASTLEGYNRFVAANNITATSGTGTAATRNNNFSDPQYNLTPIQRERNRNVRNNTENNTGTGDAPPPGNTDKIVKGKIVDFIIKLSNESTYFTVTNKLGADPTPAKGVFKRNLASSQKLQCEISVETTKFLSVGDILISKDGYVNVQIVQITEPNKVFAQWLKSEKEYSIDNIGILNTGFKSDIIEYTKYNTSNIEWNINKPKKDGEGGGGGNGSGVKQPL